MKILFSIFFFCVMTLPCFAQIMATLNYDACCVRCDSIFTPNTGISTVFLCNNALRFTVLSLNKESREIILPCTIYLPPDSRKSEKFTLSDIIHSEQCLIVRGNTDEVFYDPICAWQFRGVQQTGRFGIESDGTIARLYTGYGGTITVKIFDLTGVEVWQYSSHYISTDMQENHYQHYQTAYILCKRTMAFGMMDV